MSEQKSNLVEIINKIEKKSDFTPGFSERVCMEG